MKNRKVLVIDDERGIRQTLTQILSDEGYSVEAAADGTEALERLSREPFDLVFLDVWLKDKDGLAILESLGERTSSLPVVMISGHASVETAVKAVKSGAYDFLEKPLSLERIVLTAKKAIDHRDLQEEVARFREKMSGERALLGETPSMVRLREEIARVAPTTPASSSRATTEPGKSSSRARCTRCRIEKRARSSRSTARRSRKS